MHKMECNDRGSLFKASMSGFLKSDDKDQLMKWWWGTPRQGNLTQISDGDLVLYEHPDHVYNACIIDPKPTWFSIERVVTKFRNLKTLVVKTISDNVKDTDDSSLPIDTFVCLGDLDLSRVGNKLDKVKSIFVKNLLPLRHEKTLSGCIEFSTVRCDSTIDQLLLPSVEFLDIYSTSGPIKRMRDGPIQPKTCRITPSLVASLNLSKCTLFQLYPSEDGPLDENVAETLLCDLAKYKVRDVILSPNILTTQRLKKWYRPQILGVYAQDPIISDILEWRRRAKMPLWIYSANHFQYAAVVYNRRAEFNFNIFYPERCWPIIQNNQLDVSEFVINGDLILSSLKKPAAISNVRRKTRIVFKDGSLSVSFTLKTLYELTRELSKIVSIIKGLYHVQEIKVGLVSFSIVNLSMELAKELPEYKIKVFPNLTTPL